LKLLIINQQAHRYEALIKEQLPELEIVAAKNKGEIPALIEDVDVVLAWRVPKDVLKRAANVRWLASTGAGVDHLFMPELGDDVVITKAPPLFGRSIAEYVIGYALHVSMRVEEVLGNMKKKSWAVPERFGLHGRLMGILGMGAIGTEVAKTARFFGMKVWGLARTRRPLPEADRVFGVDELQDFLARPDFLAVTLPLTDETRNMLGADQFALMKSSCWIINVGRGRILDEESLATKLREGNIGGYVADVFATEPLPEESPLWTLPNAIITPHYAGLTRPEDFVPSFVDNVRRFSSRSPLHFQIDRQKGY
jgi:phosphoglycerate dehydrogenase-like enzyme